MDRERSRVDNVMKLKAAGLISLETAIRSIYPTWDDGKVQAEVAKIVNENLIL